METSQIILIQEIQNNSAIEAKKKSQEELSLSTLAIAASSAHLSAYTVGRITDAASLTPPVSDSSDHPKSPTETGQKKGSGLGAKGPGNRLNAGGGSGYHSPGAGPSDSGSWPVNWPTDPLNDPGFDFNLNVQGRPIIDPLGGNGILQELFAMLNALKNNNGDNQILPQLIQFIGNIAGDPAVANDPDIQQFFSTPISSGGQTLGQMMIYEIALQSWGNVLAQGGTLASADSALTTIMTQIQNQLSSMGITGSNPIAGDLFNQVNYELTNGASDFTATFLQQGTDRPYYYNSQGQVVYFDNLNSPPSMPGVGIQGFTRFINGNMSLWVAGGAYWDPSDQKTVTSDPSNLSSQLQGLFLLQFDAELKKEKNPSVLLILLFILLGTGKDGDYQTQLGGLGSTTNWLTGETQSVSSLIAQWNPNQFTGSNAAQNAINWMQSVQNLFNDADNNQGNIGGTDQTFLNTINNLVTAINGTVLPSDMTQGLYPPGTTIGQLFNHANGYDPTGSDLARALNELAGGGSTPSVTTPILDNLNTASKSYTDRSQTVQTSTSADASQDNQLTGILNTALNDSTTGIVAAENAAVKAQLPG